MNYEEMSDFEINSAVHNAISNLGFSLEFLGCDRIKWSRKGEQAIFTGKVEYSKNGLIDYCNNPSDAWPIILASRINLISPVETREAWVASHTKGGGNWSLNDFSVVHKNPLRAAMIAFLMMQEQDK